MPIAVASAVAEEFDAASPRLTPAATATLTVVLSASASAIASVPCGSAPTVIAPVFTISSFPSPPSMPVAFAVAVPEESARPKLPAASPIDTPTDVEPACASIAEVASISPALAMVSSPRPPPIPVE